MNYIICTLDDAGKEMIGRTPEELNFVLNDFPVSYFAEKKIVKIK
jgi:hypothetical protein